ncbi:MAG: alpha-L-fucosidase [Bacteroidales bacterium]|nr:alpha-L-fucosidase [Bacteroidales bacterium]MDT8374705.1 alpha-L-fucosidase [Bacteroidales bacterium]
MQRYLLMLLMTLMMAGLAAQEHDERYVPETDPLVLLKLEEWQDLKFGLLMHWGPYSQWGIVESWSICAEDVGWCRRKNPDYTEYKKQYEALKLSFNPVGFNPEKWAAAARDAGMKYVIFTTKHHDGFSMFDTKLTDYRITDPECPFIVNPRANVTKEIFTAFREQGFWTGAYFSKPDWHSEYYWWPNFATPDRNVNYNIKNYPERWEKFVQFTHDQIMELVGGDYGKVDILWLDGGWVQKMSEEQELRYLTAPGNRFVRTQSQDIRMDELVEKVRAVQPGMIVVDRAVHGKNQNYLTPENRVPEKALPYPWESCIISGGGWAWVPDPKFMPARAAVQLLVDIVVKGGNLLLNIGPAPDGTWPDGAYTLLAEMGRWMKINGEAIYGTRAMAPYKDGKVCINSKGDDTWYLFYMADEGEAMPASMTMNGLTLPAGAKVTMLGSDTRCAWKNGENSFTVFTVPRLRKDPPSDYVWVMKIVK